jgi:tetratricopeptide (TPR) repeat protein
MTGGSPHADGPSRPGPPPAGPAGPPDGDGFRERARRIAERKRQGAWAEAEAALRAELESDPENPFWQADLADLWAKAGRPKDALALADQLLERRPGYPPALTARAEALQRLGRRQEALEAWQAAWRARPSGDAAARLARAWAASGDPEKAVQFAWEALERFPDHTGLKAALALLCEQSGREDEARRLYAELAAGEDAEYEYGRLVRLLVADGEPEEAAAEVAALLRSERRARNPHLHRLRGELLERAGRTDEALDAYRRAWEAASQRDPGEVFFLGQLAYALHRAERHEDAMEALERLLERDPGDYVGLSAYVAAAKSLGDAGRERARRFLVSLVRRHPERKSLWGWVRRLD